LPSQWPDLENQPYPQVEDDHGQSEESNRLWGARHSILVVNEAIKEIPDRRLAVNPELRLLRFGREGPADAQQILTCFLWAGPHLLLLIADSGSAMTLSFLSAPVNLCFHFPMDRFISQSVQDVAERPDFDAFVCDDGLGDVPIFPLERYRLTTRRDAEEFRTVER